MCVKPLTGSLPFLQYFLFSLLVFSYTLVCMLSPCGLLESNSCLLSLFGCPGLSLAPGKCLINVSWGGGGG